MYLSITANLFQCTNKKAWKDIAAQLGIGPSSSGAYTLKKHYGKNLLPFECHFERGGIDPGPILSQVEAQSKKKGKAAQSNPRAPSPGSQVGNEIYLQQIYGTDWLQVKDNICLFANHFSLTHFMTVPYISGFPRLLHGQLWGQLPRVSRSRRPPWSPAWPRTWSPPALWIQQLSPGSWSPALRPWSSAPPSR